MKGIILYPTETVYGLGVNALDPEALRELFVLKGRDESQTVSWMVRDIAHMKEFAEMSDTAERVAEFYLPGSLTLVLPAKDTVPPVRSAPDNTIGFRVPNDPIAQALTQRFDVPLTCTSANISGLTPGVSPKDILEQFGEQASAITEVIDDGPREGVPSTVVRIVGDKVEVLREGALPARDILDIL